jgi:putative membrane protein
MRGRGVEAVMLTALGGLGGAIALVLIGGPLCPRLLPPIHAVFRRHAAWVLWAVIAFMLLSEWPKEGGRGQGGWRRWLAAWKGLGAGLLTFLLAGLLGFVLMYRSPIPADAAFQNLLPAFAGLFGMPWLILNLACNARIPPQLFGRALSVSRRGALRGVCAGCLGGGFAAFFPVITGGIGGMLAGHATAQRDDRVFLVAQGASKFVYYVGGLLLLFVPGLGLTRGGAAWMMRGLIEPDAPGAYALALGSIAVSAGLAFALTAPLARAIGRAMARRGQRPASAVSLVLIVLLIAAAVGAPGLLVLAVATGIGLVPVLFHSRRMNALGVILLPMACNMSGFGADVAVFLGLL